MNAEREERGELEDHTCTDMYTSYILEILLIQLFSFQEATARESGDFFDI